MLITGWLVAAHLVKIVFVTFEDDGNDVTIFLFLYAGVEC